MLGITKAKNARFLYLVNSIFLYLLYFFIDHMINTNKLISTIRQFDITKIG